MKNIFCVRLPETTIKELERISQEEKEPVSQLLRESIERFLRVRRFRQLRKKVLPFAEAQGLITDEDIFKAIEK